MFIEASAPRREGDNAFLVSESFERTTGTGRCMRFWYHMAGTGMGTLNIYIRPVSDPSLSPMTKFSSF